MRLDGFGTSAPAAGPRLNNTAISKVPARAMDLRVKVAISSAPYLK
jgi:hypothetical protein